MTKFIDPLNTDRLVSDGGLTAPTFTNNIGELGNIVNNSIAIYNDLKEREKKLQLENKKNLADLYLLNKEDEHLQFTNLIKTDEKYKNNPDEFNTFLSSQTDKWENFLKQARDYNFSDEELEKIKFKANSIDLKTDTDWKTDYTKYLEKENQKVFFLATDGKRENARNYMAKGEIGNALNSFNGFVDNIMQGVDNGYINPDKAIEDIRLARGNIVEGGAISIADTFKNLTLEEQLKSLDKVYDWSFEEFSNTFDKFNYNKNGFNIPLNDDDYFKFKTKIKQQREYIKTKSEADKELLKYEEVAKQNEIKNNPVKSAYKQGEYLAGTPTTTILKEVAVNATNNKFGTNFKSLDDIMYSDTPIITIQKGYNDKLSIYNDPTIESKDIIENRLKEKFEFVGGQDSIIQNRIMNDQYSFEDSPFVPSNKELELYQENQGYNKIFDTLYSPLNKEFLITTSKANIKEDIGILLDNFTPERIKRNFEKSSYVGASAGFGEYMNGKIIQSPSSGGVLSAIKESSIYDRTQKFLLDNISQRTSDIVKVHVLNETNGILDEGVAKKIKIEKKAGLPINSLPPEDQTKIFNYYMANPSKELKAEVNQVIEYFTKDYKTVDTGYGMININKADYNDNIGKNIATIINTTQFYNDKEQLIPPKRVAPMYFEDMKILTLAYRGQKVYIKKDGKLVPYIYKIGG